LLYCDAVVDVVVVGKSLTPEVMVLYPALYEDTGNHGICLQLYKQGKY